MRTIGKLTSSVAIAAAVGLVVAACSSSSPASTTAFSNKSGCKSATQNSNVVAPPGYTVCLWASATTKANHPDNVVVDGSKVWIGWQNLAAKDGTDTKTSTISEYTTDGKLLKSWSVIGHSDGMRMDPTTHQLWVLSNEDANPRLYTINPSSSAVTQHKVPKLSSGGGIDDLQFVKGVAYIDASNPTLNAAGKNPSPALYKVTLSGSNAVFTKVLMGETKATTLNPPITNVTLNLTDPDSMMIDPQGNLVLDSQADNEMLFIHNVGTPSQKVSVLSVGTQVDDTVWPSTSKGCLLVTDNNSGVYSVCSSIWAPGTPFTSVANDSTVASFVGTISSSGVITPVIVGIANPHGMGFIPQ